MAARSANRVNNIEERRRKNGYIRMGRMMIFKMAQDQRQLFSLCRLAFIFPFLSEEKFVSCILYSGDPNLHACQL
jgi:hypothetical protein